MVILRVISGTAKGHKLKTPKGMSTRPTTDRVKESLFNIIMEYIKDAEVLDLFAGTGSLGIEALSRGAKFSVFVDKSRECASLINENLTHTRFSDKSQVFSGEAQSAVRKLSAEGKKFDIIFLDPPYSKNLVEETMQIILENDIMKDGCIVVAESDIKDEVPEALGGLNVKRTQKYGDTKLSFYVYKV